MKFAILADTHIGRTIPLAVGQHRVQAFSKAFSHAVDAMIEEGVDYLFLCGDLFERRTLRPHLVFFVHDELYRLATETMSRHGKHVQILVIRGNHDGSPGSNTLDYIKHPLARYLFVFDEEKRIYTDPNLVVLGIGHYDQVDRAFSEIVKPLARELSPDRTRILILHAFILGQHNVPADTPAYSADQLGELPLDYVFAGHYHKACQPSRLKSGAWMLTPGSLEIYDFGEESEKGFWLLETRAEHEPQFTWVKIEPMHTMRRVELRSKLRNPPEWYREQILRAVRDFSSELGSSDKSGYIRIVVSGGLSEGFPSDIDLSEIDGIRAANRGLLHVDVDTIELELPILSASFEHEQVDLPMFFKDFNDFTPEITEMHSRVRESLEENASVQTGLLSPSHRAPLIEDWLRRFRTRRFGGPK